MGRWMPHRRCTEVTGFQWRSSTTACGCTTVPAELARHRGDDGPAGWIVSYETIHQWCRKFSQNYANGLRRRRARPGDTWHLDEVFIKIAGKTHYLWRAVDQAGNVLDVLVTSRRDAKAATRFFRKCSKAHATYRGCWSLTSWPAMAWRIGG